MNQYEIISLIVQGIIALGAIVFGAWQILINRRLIKIQDYIVVAILPDNGVIKLLNTGKINLYIHAFEVGGNTKKLDKGRLISSASLGSAYYWIPTDFVPRESKNFDIKIYLTDEFGSKYLTEGGGKSERVDEQKSKIIVWTYKTIKSDWKF